MILPNIKDHLINTNEREYKDVKEALISEMILGNKDIVLKGSYSRLI